MGAENTPEDLRPAGVVTEEGSSALKAKRPPADGGQTAWHSPSDDAPSGPTLDRVGGHARPAPRERPVPTIPGYEILGELGRGGMGIVYRAREVRLNRPCALKMILGGAHAGDTAALRFLAEAEAVARLQHPNIVQIHHIGEADGLPFFELEYIGGGSLDKRLDGAPRPPRESAQLVEALARGVAEAHRLGIVHRDLKPANVLLAADGTPKVTDFGLAKSLGTDGGLTATDSIMGSPGYMSPEQAEGRTREVGPPADIYALGAILYELVTGRPPFVGTSILETLEQVRTTEPVAPSRLVPRLPRDVETIALKCLHKEPSKRYESATALADDLRRFLGGESILARPVGPIERGWRWCRRNPVVAGLTGTLAALLVLATAASLVAYGHMSQLAHGEHRARLAADKETQAARAAREQEATERQRAEANFRRARAAVDRYLTTVSESQLLKVPGLQPLRGELLGSALGFYHDFLKERGDDPTLRAELAATQARIGRIHAELGAAGEARQALKAAIAAYEAEILRSPQDRAARAALADTWVALGELAYHFGGKDQGREMLAASERAAELREGLARGRPDDLDLQRGLAEAYDRLGVAQNVAGRDGLPARLRGAELRLAHFLKSPYDPKLNAGLGESLNNFAVVLSNAGRHEDALVMYLRSQEYTRFAYEKAPHLIDFGCDLGTSHMNAVRAYRNLGRKEEAVAEARRAVEQCRGLVRDHPAATIAKRQLVWALEALVESQRDAGRAAEAARTGRELGQWIDTAVDDPQRVFDGALWHARLSLWADERKGLPSTREQDEAQREADRAVEQLQRATESGFADLEAIRGEKTLDPLRGRPDFRKVVANLEQRLKERPGTPPVVTRPEGKSAHQPVPLADRVFRARADRAAILHAVGLIQRGRDRRQEARAALDESRTRCERLLAERPADAPLRATLAATHNALGGLDWDAGQLREAAEAFARAEAVAPEDPAAYRMAAVVHARRGCWDLAAGALARLIERDAGGHGDWCLAAALRARSGDRDLYRRLCRQMLGRFGEEESPAIAERTAKYCLLLPSSGPEQVAADRLAGRAVEGAGDGLRHWAGAAQGLADYRAGRFAGALAALEKAQAAAVGGGDWYFQVPAGCVRAMALMRLGRRDEARAALEKASAVYRSNSPPTIPLDHGWYWNDELICDILHSEAEAVILRDPAFPADPFVP